MHKQLTASIKKLISKIKKIVKAILLKVYKNATLDNNVIVFESSAGRNCTGNPMAIYMKMVEQGLDKKYTCIWSTNNMKQGIEGRAKKVKRLSLTYFHYMGKAKFWIMDSRQPAYLDKKEGNVYIQTWHGTPLKKLGLDMEFINMSGNKDIKEYREFFKKNSSRWDYLISQNDYSTHLFRRCFAFDKEILDIGYPRNDVLFNSKEEKIKALKEKLKIPEGYKVILYAPTWRDNQYSKKGKYKFKLPISLKDFSEQFGDKYILLLKPHYLVADKIKTKGYSHCVKKCSVKQDIQDLYLISDIMITDYSSVMFDYSLLERPMIFYMYDLDEYQGEIREFYFDILEEAPGPIVKNKEELMEAIANIDMHQKVYHEKYERFRSKYNGKDDGSASKKIIELIESHYNKAKECIKE